MSRLSGGCQCGAVRFSVEKAGIGTASICHCRMCQKAFGAFYAPLVSVQCSSLVWTRGERALFRSSNQVRRGFCAACGTPLTYEPDTGATADLAIGAFDDPAGLPPMVQFGIERKLPYTDHLGALPGRPTMPEDEAPYLGSILSHQHPDRDTDMWPIHNRKPSS